MGLRVSDSSAFQFESIGPIQLPFERRWQAPRISYEYGVHVVDDAKAPTPRRSKAPEAWRVGIVQNVVAQTIRIVYAKDTIFKKRWTSPLLDATDPSALPFYAPPVLVDVKVPGAALGNTVTIPLFASISAKNGPDGVHFVFPTPNKRPRDWDDRDAALSFGDCPGFSVPTYSGKNILLETNHLITLHFWVVALGPSGPVVLAESAVFTLVMVMKFLLEKSETKASDSRHPWYNSAALAGIITSVPEHIEKRGSWERFVGKHDPNIRFGSPAKSKPLTTGPLANAVGREWIAENGLIPISASSHR